MEDKVELGEEVKYSTLHLPEVVADRSVREVANWAVRNSIWYSVENSATTSAKISIRRKIENGG